MQKFVLAADGRYGKKTWNLKNMNQVFVAPIAQIN